MKKSTTTKQTVRDPKEGDDSPSQLIDAKIAELGGWRGEMLARVRAIIRQADPEVVETVKWRKPSNPSGVPVWEHDGIVCTGETYKDKVKLTFARGAALKDPARLFNASLDAGTRRAIDIRGRATPSAKRRSRRLSAPPWRSIRTRRSPHAPSMR